MEYVPVMLSTPIVVVMPVKVPEAVVLREELHAAVVVQDYSYIYVSGMVLTNPGITPSSHNSKQLKNAYG